VLQALRRAIICYYLAAGLIAMPDLVSWKLSPSITRDGRPGGNLQAVVPGSGGVDSARAKLKEREL
jgi:hypothetical protein